MEALRLAQHKRFGASSEKSEETFMEQLSLLFNEAETFSDAAEKADTAEEKAAGEKAHKRRKKHEYTLDNIPATVQALLPWNAPAECRTK